MPKSCLAAAIASTAGLALACAGSARSAEPDCVSQSDVDVARIDASVIFVGEVHGTREIPRFVSALACSLLQAGRPVILGIEHAGEQQAAVNRYIASSGDAARADLLEGINWKTYDEGRGSQAMFELIDAVRDLHHKGQPVSIVAIDRNENIEVARKDLLGPVSPADNAALNRIANEAMDDSVLYAMYVYRPYVVVTLAGYSHTSTVLAKTDDPMFLTYRPTGRIVADETPVFTIGIDSGGGNHSGPGPGSSMPYAVKPGILYEPGTRIDAMVHIDHLSASPPARDTAR